MPHDLWVLCNPFGSKAQRRAFFSWWLVLGNPKGCPFLFAIPLSYAIPLPLPEGHWALGTGIKKRTGHWALGIGAKRAEQREEQNFLLRTINGWGLLFCAQDTALRYAALVQLSLL